MISYIIVLLAVLCFALQFAMTKVYEQCVKQTAVTSFVMLVIAGIVGAIIYLCVGGFKVNVSLISIALASIFAIIMIPYYIVSIKVLSLGSLAIYSMFMMLGGMLLPFVYGLLFLNESVSWGKIAGCVIMGVFIVLQGIAQNEAENRKIKNKQLFFILCLCIFVVNGLTGVIATVHQNHTDAVDEISFTVLTCVITVFGGLIALIVVWLFQKKSQNFTQLKNIIKVKPLILVSVIGAAMHTGNYLILKAASHIPATVQFPLISGGTIVFSALISVLCFKEKMSKKELFCVVGAFVSTVLFTF